MTDKNKILPDDPPIIVEAKLRVLRRREAINRYKNDFWTTDPKFNRPW